MDPLRNVSQCAQMLESGGISAAELVSESIARIAQRDESLRAIISIDVTAIDQAAQSDNRRRDGRLLGPFDGVPVVVKDCIETANLPTTHGSPLFANWRAQRDAAVVECLRQAGAIVVAKANLDDFAATTIGVSSIRGTMRNPHDTTRSVGGSSGGSASAVAAGYVPLAVGTDTGGSLRIPAAACGVATLRPTQGLVPTDGVFPRSFDQDTVGPIGASVASVAAGLSVMAGGASLSAKPRDLHGVRLGVVRSGLAIGGGWDSSVARVFDAFLAELAASAVRLVELNAPPRDLLDRSCVITQQSADAVDAYLAARPDAPVGSFVELVKSGAFTAAAGENFSRELDYVDSGADLLPEALAARRELLRWTRKRFALHGLDAVIYPTAQCVATVAGHQQPGIYTRWSEHAGCPALAVPFGCVGGLPVSVELLGLPNSEALLVATGGAVEKVAGYLPRPGSC